jgi:hypothetical protein
MDGARPPNAPLFDIFYVSGVVGVGPSVISSVISLDRACCGLHVDVVGRAIDCLVVELRLKYCCRRHGWHLKRSTLFFVGEMGDFGG